LESFIVEHSEAIKDECRIFINGKVCSRNLFLPTSVGGLGVSCPQGFKFRITPEQRLLGASMVGNNHLDCFPSPYRPLRPIRRLKYRPYDIVPLDEESDKHYRIGKDVIPLTKRKIVVGSFIGSPYYTPSLIN
jgi:hypothetical protein